MEKVKLHIGLARVFALPAAVAGILLGCVLVGGWSWLTLIIILCASFLMFYSHSFNTFLDYYWTKFDRGTEEERSRAKIYTAGQQPLALGIAKGWEVLANGLICLAISAAFAAVISWKVSPWVWLPWGLTVPMTFFYSWAKLHYCPEIPLGLGFGSFGVMLGACTVASPPLWTAFLAGLPFAFLWGAVAETMDQYLDYDVNYEKGLRNIGALIGHFKLRITYFLGFLMVLVYLIQLALVIGGVLAPLSLLSLLALPLVIYCMLYLEWDERIGIYLGLAAIFVHMVLLVVGQALGG